MPRYRIVSYIFLLLFLCIVGAVVTLYLKKPSYLEVYFLNVGQGDAIFIETPDKKQILIDAGPDNRVLSELSHVMPIWDRSIDIIIPTHDDKDHIGGFPEVLDRYTVSEIIRSSTESESAIAFEFEEKSIEEGAYVHVAEAGKRFTLDEEGLLFFDILHPIQGSAYEDRNNGSTIIRLVYKNQSFLFMGDAGKGIERLLVSSLGDSLESTVLKVGHHGSRTSSDPIFLQTVSPLHAIISAGKDNKYGHPHTEVVTALLQQQITVLDTRNGRIACISDGIFLDCGL